MLIISENQLTKIRVWTIKTFPGRGGTTTSGGGTAISGCGMANTGDGTAFLLNLTTVAR